MRHNFIAAAFIDPPFDASYIRASCRFAPGGLVHNRGCIQGIPCITRIPYRVFLAHIFPESHDSPREDVLLFLRPGKRPGSAVLS
jgi:hypothetical protein